MGGVAAGRRAARLVSGPSPAGLCRCAGRRPAGIGRGSAQHRRAAGPWFSEGIDAVGRCYDAPQRQWYDTPVACFVSF